MASRRLPFAPSEAEFRAHVVDTLGTLGYLRTAIRRSDGVTIGDVGLPDVVAVHQRTGAVVALELKVGRNVATPAQVDWLCAFNRYPGDRAVLARVVYPDDWEDVAGSLVVLAGMRLSKGPR